jgi:hypothetical protein
VETSWVSRLTSAVRGRGPAAVSALPAAAGATQLVVGLAPALRARNRVAVVAATAPPGDQGSTHDVSTVLHDAALGRTTLTLSSALPAAVPAGSAVTVLVPVLVGSPSGTAPDPCLHLDLTDLREDLASGWQVAQRDSLRRRPGGTTCCLRPAPRPVVVEYQVLVESTEPAQAGALRGDVLACLGTELPLRVDGVELPVATVPSPVRTERTRDVLTPVVVQIGTRLETGPRVETRRPTSVGVVAAPFDARDDTERIVVPS